MLKVGILGGGQLGRMLLQAAANYQVTTYVMENDENCPSAHLCHHFRKGDIRNYEDVLAFGKNLDAITIEIENVNVDALEKLEQDGVKVFPNTSALKTIRNKILQKEFYKANNVPTSEFRVVENRDELSKHLSFFPAVQKLAEGGYDGKGVEMMNTENDLTAGFDEASVLEKKVNIKKEIAVIVACDQRGKTVVYPPVEMIFNRALHLLDFQICPADLEQNILWKTEAIALSLVRSFKSPGLFAVELFIDEKNEVLVNETAPRVHNSGHHTIEAHYSSQFDMLWRIMLDLPLGNSKPISHSVMINLIGAEGFQGHPIYRGIEKVLEMDSAFIHLYGKTQTKPGRKMGHITVLGKEKQDLLYKGNLVRQSVQVEA